MVIINIRYDEILDIRAVIDPEFILLNSFRKSCDEANIRKRKMTFMFIINPNGSMNQTSNKIPYKKTRNQMWIPTRPIFEKRNLPID